MKEGFQIVFMMIVKSIMMEVELIIRIAQKNWVDIKMTP